MSTSSAEPSVTVVIGSNAPPARLAGCLEALEPQRGGVEVLVHAGVPVTEEVRSRFPWADVVESPGALMPELWRDGIRRAEGDIVAITIAQMAPAPDWIATIRAQLGAREAIGGAIEPGERLRLADWGEFFCRYARDLRPFDAHPNPGLPGDNAAFARARLREIDAELDTGYWEPVAHPALERLGVTLWHTPDLLVRMGRSAGFGAFMRQRLEHGRRYGHQRGVHFSRARNLVGALAAPAVVCLMTLRVLGEVFSRGRLRVRALVALPAILAFNAAWAGAEALGHLDMLRGADGDA